MAHLLPGFRALLSAYFSLILQDRWKSLNELPTKWMQNSFELSIENDFHSKMTITGIELGHSRLNVIKDQWLSGTITHTVCLRT